MWSQIKSPVCDTCFKSEWIEKKANADSNLRLQKQKLDERKDSVLKQQKQSAKNKVQGQKDKFRDKTDSSARAALQQKARETAFKPVNQAKDLSKNKWQQVKAKLPDKKQVIRFSGEIRSENYYTTAQNPVLRNEPMYSRLYVSPTVTLLGLPFKANFFFTTESNNTYKNNFFSIRFDANAMRLQAMADMQKQMDELKKLDRLRQVDIQRNVLETQRYEQELERLKSKVPDGEALKDELKRRAEEKSREYMEQEKARLEEKLRNASEEEKMKLEQEFRQKQDSIINHYKQEAGDSLLKARSKFSPDTSGLGQYLRMQEKIDELKSRRQEIEDLRQFDSAQLTKKVSGIRNPDDIRAMAKDQMPGKKLLNSILSVDRFGIGLVNPQYSELTLYAASVKGLDIGINKDKYFYDVTMGKTSRQFTGLLSDVKPMYERYIGVARVGYGELRGNHISVEYMYAFDPVSVHDRQTPMVRNGVINLNTQFQLLQHTTVEADLAQSDYKETYQSLQSNYSGANASFLDASANKAYRIKATQEVNDNIKAEIMVRQTGAAFRTVGNPFLRRNFREMEVKYEQQFLKKRLKFSGFYKEMRDNLIELNKATNRMKGYGLRLSTSFEKYPNITLGYSPYQQGNNHPDSLYRTNNQFSVTNAILTYKKSYKGISWAGLVNYTRSAMELSGRGTVAYRHVSTIHTLQIGQRQTAILSYLSNVTMPFVDSLNSNSYQASHMYKLSKTFSAGVIGEYTAYKNDAFRAGGGIQLNMLALRSLSITLQTRYDRVDKLWQLQDADVFTGKMIVMWRW